MPVQGRVVVSELYCKGCELCISVCPKGALRLALNRITVKGYHPAALATDACTGCGICAVMCPEAAIVVYREVLKTRQAQLLEA